MKKNVPLILAFLILLPALILARQRQIRSKITDENGAPVPDVSVAVKGGPAQRFAADGSFVINDTLMWY